MTVPICKPKQRFNRWSRCWKDVTRRKRQYRRIPTIDLYEEES